MRQGMLACRFAPIVMLVLSGCQESENAPNAARHVLSQVVEMEPATSTHFAGLIQPRVQAVFGPRVGGLLVARDVDTGATVSKGQLLAVLDPTALILAVNAARAELTSAEATLANATSVEQRTTALLKIGTETKAAAERAEQSTAAARASVVQARAALSKAEEQLSYTRITAAFDGIVTATAAEAGQVLSAGASVVTVAKPGERDAVVDVSDSDQSFALGAPFSVVLQINPAVSVTGKVREIAPLADQATRTRRVKIALDRPPESFRLGTTITAYLQQAVPERMLVSASAIRSVDGKSYVWLIDEDMQSVTAKEVRTGPSENGWVPVIAGIKPGTRIVTAGIKSLKDGDKVRFGDTERP